MLKPFFEGFFFLPFFGVCVWERGRGIKEGGYKENHLLKLMVGIGGFVSFVLEEVLLC